jgi:hypothetical protein
MATIPDPAPTHPVLEEERVELPHQQGENEQKKKEERNLRQPASAQPLEASSSSSVAKSLPSDKLMMPAKNNKAVKESNIGTNEKSLSVDQLTTESVASDEDGLESAPKGGRRSGLRFTAKPKDVAQESSTTTGEFIFSKPCCHL